VAKRIYLASISGPCAGVERALRAAEQALEAYGVVYADHQVVHNTTVSESLRARGLRYVEKISEIPEGSALLLSAHGSTKATIEESQKRRLTIINAACPLVTKVHNEVVRYEQDGRAIVIIGDATHQEVVGVKGQVKHPERLFVIRTKEDVAALPLASDERVAYVTQTTLNVFEVQDVIDALTDRFTDIVGPGMGDVCFATKNRQDAVKHLCRTIDVLLVIGSQHSSNSKNLRKTALQLGVPAYLINDIDDLPNKETVLAHDNIGIAAGASAPKPLVEAAITKIRALYPELTVIQDDNGVRETVVFAAPKIMC
jgi:4-hydroxy-3-methylbut-2-enyl diphosphate reductase